MNMANAIHWSIVHPGLACGFVKTVIAAGESVHRVADGKFSIQRLPVGVLHVECPAGAVRHLQEPWSVHAARNRSGQVLQFDVARAPSGDYEEIDLVKFARREKIRKDQRRNTPRPQVGAECIEEIPLRLDFDRSATVDVDSGFHTLPPTWRCATALLSTSVIYAGQS
jgi:hypothetical protein